MSGPRERKAPHPGRRLRLFLEKTRRFLDGLARTYTRDSSRTDPLGLVRESNEPGDRLDRRRAAGRFERFVHRFTTGVAVGDLLWRVRMARDRAGCLERFLDAERGARRFLPAPSRGSACKRHCLFPRSVVRPDDGVDLGLGRGVSPSRLLLPLDVPFERVEVALGWTRRRSPGWPMVLDATAHLRRIDPADPVRHDFALSRLGILGLLPARGAAVLGA